MSEILISQLYTVLKAPLCNIRWSWGAQHPKGPVILSVWKDQYRRIGSAYYRKILDMGKVRENTLGHEERMRHIAAVQAGMPGFMIVCTAVDVNAHNRTISNFNATKLTPIGLIEEHDNCLWAECLTPIDTEQFMQEYNNV